VKYFWVARVSEFLFQAQEEAKEAEVSRKELGLDEGVDNLKALIQVNLRSDSYNLCTLWSICGIIFCFLLRSIPSTYLFF
jgi:hypothetical protein